MIMRFGESQSKQWFTNSVPTATMIHVKWQNIQLDEVRKNEGGGGEWSPFKSTVLAFPV
jgi:hypothetical protein